VDGTETAVSISFFTQGVLSVREAGKRGVYPNVKKILQMPGS
jgi:hypothetical protein